MFGKLDHLPRRAILLMMSRYFSYGAQFDPGFFSLFRFSHGLVSQEEGPNDGLVSVKSAQWGDYKGTLDGVSHLDLINWYAYELALKLLPFFMIC